MCSPSWVLGGTHQESRRWLTSRWTPETPPLRGTHTSRVAAKRAFTPRCEGSSPFASTADGRHSRHSRLPHALLAERTNDPTGAGWRVDRIVGVGSLVGWLPSGPARFATLPTAAKTLERLVGVGVLISVDVETCGADPWSSSLATIGAAAIDDTSLTIIDTFYARLAEPEGGWQWQPEQRAWWREQDPRVFAEAFDAGEDRRPAVEVAASFAEWALSLAPKPRFTARPVTFDWTRVAKLFGEAGIVNPFGFRGHDIGELIRGLVGAEFKEPYFDPLAITYGIEVVQSVESEHNALADAVAQAGLVIAVFNAMRERRP